MKVYTLMQSVIFHGVFHSLNEAMNVVSPIVIDVQHWPKLHSFKANGKKWHVYETTLDEKVQMD